MTPKRNDKESTGINGLDEILAGGLPARRLYVIEGSPGSGKTTFALQFLREGARLGQRVLYVTLSETLEELNDLAISHNWNLDGIDLLELDSLSERFAEGADYTVFHPSDVELEETVGRIRAEVERLNPDRVALDSVSELKILSQTGEKLERWNAHLYDRGGMRRVHLRGRTNILKRLVVHAGAANLGLLMRKLFGVGTPKALQTRLGPMFSFISGLTRAMRLPWLLKTSHERVGF